MADIVQIPEKKLDKILSTLESLKEEIKGLKSRGEKEPSYGSDAWWDWSDKKAKEDIKAGRYTDYASMDEYIRDLKKRI